MGIKYNPFSGTFDFAGSGSGSSTPNFSYNIIATGVTVTIPQYQQMVVVNFLDLQGSGQLNIVGELAVIYNG